MSQSVTRLVVVTLLSSALVCGCRRDAQPEQPSGRGIPLPGARAVEPSVEPAQPAPRAPRWQDPMLHARSEARPAMVHVEPQPLTETTTVPGEPVAGPTPRDYAGELIAKAGDVSGCVPPAETTALPPRVELDLRAVVTESGVVTRSEVQSAGLSEGALRCVRARVDAARFAAPVADAPRQVTAHVVLDRRPTPGTPAAPTP